MGGRSAATRSTWVLHQVQRIYVLFQVHWLLLNTVMGLRNKCLHLTKFIGMCSLSRRSFDQSGRGHPSKSCQSTPLHKSLRTMCVCSSLSSSIHVTLAFIFIICYSILLQDHLKQLRNMLKKSALIEAKFKVVVNKTLLKAHTLTEQAGSRRQCQ